jgi:hypothetical protein
MQIFQQQQQQQQEEEEEDGQQQQQAGATLWDGEPSDRQELQQQLFTLLVSCFKVSAVSAAEQHVPLPWVVLEASLAVATCLSSSSSSRSNSAMWVLLLARGLLACGRQLQEAASAGSISSSSSSSLHASTTTVACAAASDDTTSGVLVGNVRDATLRQGLEVDLPCVQNAVCWLVQQLQLVKLPGVVSTAAGASAGGGASALNSSSSSSVVQHELMLQAEDLQQQILQCQSALGSSEVEFGKHVEQLGAQMTALGGALCAVLPSKHCCNHTGCSNLARLSEAELVAGKACVCGR